MKNGRKIFYPYGVYDREYQSWRHDENVIKRWKEASTGYPIIDANMRELNSTGFLSNRGRLVVASFLCLDMRQDWRHGAHYFEEKLIDHDVQSNYGGWNFSAGIGSGRKNVFKTTK